MSQFLRINIHIAFDTHYPRRNFRILIFITVKIYLYIFAQRKLPIHTANANFPDFVFFYNVNDDFPLHHNTEGGGGGDDGDPPPPNTSASAEDIYTNNNCLC